MVPELRRDTVRLGNLLSIAEQIQAFGLGRKTGEIFITNVPPPARINMVEGAVVDAQFGLRSGLEAAVALINLPDPQTEFIVGEKSKRVTIDKPYIEILCDAAMAKDQAASEKEGQSTEPMRLTAGNPYLRVTVGDEIKTFPIRPGQARIGRALSNEIVLAEPTVSQEHATIEYSRSGVFLKDLKSTNGTYVGGIRIGEKWLSMQDSLQFGSLHCLFIGGVKKTGVAE